MLRSKRWPGGAPGASKGMTRLASGAASAYQNPAGESVGTSSRPSNRVCVKSQMPLPAAGSPPGLDGRVVRALQGVGGHQPGHEVQLAEGDHTVVVARTLGQVGDAGGRQGLRRGCRTLQAASPCETTSE